MSRYDPRDPGQDPAYCDGLAAHPVKPTAIDDEQVEQLEQLRAEVQRLRQVCRLVLGRLDEVRHVLRRAPALDPPLTPESIRQAKEAQRIARVQFEVATGYRIADDGTVVRPDDEDM